MKRALTLALLVVGWPVVHLIGLLDRLQLACDDIWED